MSDYNLPFIMNRLSIDTQDNISSNFGISCSYVISQIRVFITNSDIYSTDLEDHEMDGRELNTKEFILNLPVYTDLKIPINTLMGELIKISNIRFDEHQILYYDQAIGAYILLGTFPFKEFICCLNGRCRRWVKHTFFS